MKSTAIVLSAGSGKRMGANRPKQYLDLAGHPVIYYSLKAFEESPVDRVILVTGKEDVAYCKEEIVKRYGFTKVSCIVPGGAERYDSVYQGLLAMGEPGGEEYVLIHDGARPMLSQTVIASLLDAVQKEGACVAAVPVKDTIKIADGAGFAKETPNRNTLWTIQTPQVFSYSIIKKAYDCIYTKDTTGLSITDDAMVVETFTNQKVKLVMSEYTNLKVTTPEDLVFAEALIKGANFF